MLLIVALVSGSATSVKHGVHGRKKQYRTCTICGERRELRNIARHYKAHARYGNSFRPRKFPEQKTSPRGSRDLKVAIWNAVRKVQPCLNCGVSAAAVTAMINAELSQFPADIRQTCVTTAFAVARGARANLAVASSVVPVNMKRYHTYRPTLSTDAGTNGVSSESKDDEEPVRLYANKFVIKKKAKVTLDRVTLPAQQPEAPKPSVEEEPVLQIVAPTDDELATESQEVSREKPAGRMLSTVVKVPDKAEKSERARHVSPERRGSRPSYHDASRKTTDHRHRSRSNDRQSRFDRFRHTRSPSMRGRGRPYRSGRGTWYHPAERQQPLEQMKNEIQGVKEVVFELVRGLQQQSGGPKPGGPSKSRQPSAP